MTDEHGEVAPEGLAIALDDLGLRLAGPLGTGSRGPLWSAVAADGGRWAVGLLVVRSAMHGARLQDRATRLARVDHEHLARVGAAVPLPDGRLAVLHRAVDGTDLATLLAARNRWAPGEVVTVVVPLAAALGALHAAGLAHGDVAPANVVLDDGRPVLVDVLTGDDPLEAGTPGFAAPDRARGAGPAGDVHALARLGLALLGDAAGSEAERLRGVLRTGCATDPAARPDAAALAVAVFEAGPAEPVRRVDPAVLARLSLSRLAAEDPGRTQRRPARDRGRHRRRRSRRPAGVLAVGATAVAVAVLATGPWPAAREVRSAARDLWPGGGSGEVALVAAGVPAPSAAVRLTQHRAAALLARDADALARVTVPGSPAAVADRQALHAVRAALGPTAPADADGAGGPGGGSVAVVVDSVRLEPRGPGPVAWRRVAGRAPASCRDVVLSAEVRGTPSSEPAAGKAAVAHEAVAAGSPPGAQGASGASGAPELVSAAGVGARTVRLTLCATADGWRVARVAPEAVPTTGSAVP